MGVNGKILKMCNILKMADRKAKGTKIWDSWYYSAHGRVLLMPDSLSLGWGHSVHFSDCKISDVMIFKAYSSPSFHSILPKLSIVVSMLVLRKFTLFLVIC